MCGMLGEGDFDYWQSAHQSTAFSVFVEIQEDSRTHPEESHSCWSENLSEAC